MSELKENKEVIEAKIETTGTISLEKEKTPVEHAKEDKKVDDQLKANDKKEDSNNNKEDPIQQKEPSSTSESSESNDDKSSDSAANVNLSTKDLNDKGASASEQSSGSVADSKIETDAQSSESLSETKNAELLLSVSTKEAGDQPREGEQSEKVKHENDEEKKEDQSALTSGIQAISNFIRFVGSVPGKEGEESSQTATNDATKAQESVVENQTEKEAPLPKAEALVEGEDSKISASLESTENSEVAKIESVQEVQVVECKVLETSVSSHPVESEANKQEHKEDNKSVTDLELKQVETSQSSEQDQTNHDVVKDTASTSERIQESNLETSIDLSEPTNLKKLDDSVSNAEPISVEEVHTNIQLVSGILRLANTLEEASNETKAAESEDTKFENVAQVAQVNAQEGTDIQVEETKTDTENTEIKVVAEELKTIISQITKDLNIETESSSDADLDIKKHEITLKLEASNQDDQEQAFEEATKLGEELVQVLSHMTNEFLKDIEETEVKQQEEVKSTSESEEESEEDKKRRDLYTNVYGLTETQYNLIRSFFNDHKEDDVFFKVKRLAFMIKKFIDEHKHVKASEQDVERALTSVDNDNDDLLNFSEFVQFFLLFFATKYNLGKRLDSVYRIRSGKSDAVALAKAEKEEKEDYVSFLQEFFALQLENPSDLAEKDEQSLRDFFKALRSIVEAAIYVIVE